MHMRTRATSRAVTKRPRARRGVGLLETLVALTLAVAGLSVALAAISQSVRAQRVIERSRAETTLARSLVEEAFLGLLPQEEKADSTGSADIWRGVSPEGIEWEVQVRSTLMGSFNAQAIDTEGGLGQFRGMAPGQVAIELVVVRAGNTEVRTTRW
jgi:type II secretory pathway pseudopilin PulG